MNIDDAVGEVRRLDTKPGDIVVITSPRRLTPDEWAYVEKQMTTALRDHGIRVVVVEEGVTVDVHEPTGEQIRVYLDAHPEHLHAVAEREARFNPSRRQVVGR
jgi:hypothetical protein